MVISVYTFEQIPLLLSSIPIFFFLFLLQHLLPLLSALSHCLSKQGSAIPIFFWDGNSRVVMCLFDCHQIHYNSIVRLLNLMLLILLQTLWNSRKSSSAAFLPIPPQELQVKCLCDPLFQCSALSSARSGLEGKQLCSVFHVVKPRLSCDKICKLEQSYVGKTKLLSKLSSDIKEENISMQRHTIHPKMTRDWPFCTWPMKS